MEIFLNGEIFRISEQIEFGILRGLKMMKFDLNFTFMSLKSFGLVIQILLNQDVKVVILKNCFAAVHSL